MFVMELEKSVKFIIDYLSLFTSNWCMEIPQPVREWIIIHVGKDMTIKSL